MIDGQRTVWIFLANSNTQSFRTSVLFCNSHVNPSEKIYFLARVLLKEQNVRQMDQVHHIVDSYRQFLFILAVSLKKAHNYLQVHSLTHTLRFPYWSPKELSVWSPFFFCDCTIWNLSGILANLSRDTDTGLSTVFAKYVEGLSEVQDLASVPFLHKNC
jgi:hypothetical protein